MLVLWLQILPKDWLDACRFFLKMVCWPVGFQRRQIYLKRFTSLFSLFFLVFLDVLVLYQLCFSLFNSKISLIYFMLSPCCQDSQIKIVNVNGNQISLRIHSYKKQHLESLKSMDFLQKNIKIVSRASHYTVTLVDSKCLLVPLQKVLSHFYHLLIVPILDNYFVIITTLKEVNKLMQI